MFDFRRINIDVDGNLAIEFRRDSFVSSFGTDSSFVAHEYFDWLTSHMTKNNFEAFHIWMGKKIVGQLELGMTKKDEHCGWIYLYYLIPDLRGKGYSKELNQFAEECLRDRGALRAEMNVSPENHQALKAYLKHGWIDAGPDPLDHKIHLMKKNL